MAELEKLQKAIRSYGRQADLAHKLYVSVSYVSAVYRGNKPPSERFLDELGLERVVTYRSKAPSRPKPAHSGER